MPDTRSHRGPHPDDRQLFSQAEVPQLRAATDDLCWLLDRAYTTNSALKLVGDRYSLTSRQRTAVSRCAASHAMIEDRKSRLVAPPRLKDRTVWIDGYNVLTTVEAALGGGVILAAKDGCYRDMASMHGSYRKVAETLSALDMIGNVVSGWHVAGCRWLLDSPVSNSGRLKRILSDIAAARGWNWDVELVQDPDAVLIESDKIVATADSVILNKCRSWLNLARHVVERISSAWIVDLS